MIVLTPTNDAVSLEDRRYRLVDSLTGDLVDDGVELTRDAALELKARLTVAELAEEEQARESAPKAKRRKPKP